jgi:biopolymer transport protein ExbB/TolQ
MEHGIIDVMLEASIAVQITMGFMAILSVYTLYRVIERVITYSSASDQTISFVLGLRGHLKAHRFEDALKSAESHAKSPVSKVIGSGLRAFQQGQEAQQKQGPHDVGEFDLVDSVNRSIERVKERETSGLRKGLAGLGTVATCTPFIGLFGTVIGIINAFALLKGNATIEVIGPAIAEALYSTAFGLLVAIIAAMSYNYCTNRVEEMTVDMNDIASEFLDVILREGRA